MGDRVASASTTLACPARTTPSAGIDRSGGAIRRGPSVGDAMPSTAELSEGVAGNQCPAVGRWQGGVSLCSRREVASVKWAATRTTCGGEDNGGG